MNTEETSLLQRKIRAQLDEYIRTHPPGDKLPSEPQLAAQFGVSRTTIRAVLEHLAAEGNISKRHGSGTYINPKPFLAQENLLSHYVSYPALIEQKGFHASVGSRQVCRETAGEAEAKALQISVGDELIAILVAYFADGNLAVFCRDTFRADMICGADREAFFKSLANRDRRELLLEHTGRRPERNVTELRAVLAQDSWRLQCYLDTALPQPMIQMCTTFYDAKRQPLIYSESYLDTHYLTLRINR